jgi:hypothetical protein
MEPARLIGWVLAVIVILVLLFVLLRIAGLV